MQFYAQDELADMLSDFGRPCTIGGLPVVGYLSTKDISMFGGDGPRLVGSEISGLFRTSDVAAVRNQDEITGDGTQYKVRRILQLGGGAFTLLVLELKT